MNNKYLKIVVLVTSFAFGFLTACGVKTLLYSNNNSVTDKDLFERYISLQAEKDKLESQLATLNDEFNERNEIIANNEEKLDRCKDEMLKYMMMSGSLDMTGSGVELEFSKIYDETQMQNVAVDERDYILKIISVLNAAGAEAISVNSIRYTGVSSIMVIGDRIELDGVSLKEPITIAAIGDTVLLRSALEMNYGMVWQLQNMSFKVELSEVSNLNVPKTTVDRKYIYAVPIDSGI